MSVSEFLGYSAAGRKTWESELREELVRGRGWAVVEVDDRERLDAVARRIVNMASGFNGLESVHTVDDLRRALTDMADPEINRLKLMLLDDDDLAVQFQEAFWRSTRALAGGGSIYLQRRPHIMFNIAGKPSTVTAHHIDQMSGISPHAFVLWAAIHEIADDSGLFVVDQAESMELMNRERDHGYVLTAQTLNRKFDTVTLGYGQGVVFNPFMLHGSVAHANPLARIGVTTRFQSRRLPLFLRNSDFFYPYEMLPR